MFRPVGSQSPSVYWRRRLSLIGAVIAIVVLAVLTITALTGGGNTDAAGGSPGLSQPASAPATAPVTTGRGSAGRTSTRKTLASSTAPGSTTSGSTTSGSTTSGSDPAPSKCSLSALKIAAVVGMKSYSVGASPVVALQVTNTGTQPCVQDLADPQIELRVYNGTSRVWGSHDCAIKRGTDKRTLAVGRKYVLSVLWGGLSSQKGCTGTRQRIGAGKYTLYALLAGKMGSPTTFTIS